MQDNLIDTQITEKFDCVCCISLLEHVMPHFQEQALTNLIKYVRKGGILLLTFDMPGFEYTTDLTLYLKVLRQQRCAVTVEETKEDERISTASSDVADSSLISKNLSCYRIFAEQK
jgi:2-polyprenyl-3-methyl-5-hydroxy-6-metoxy-1,4-benzoquinol methylase